MRFILIILIYLAPLLGYAQEELLPPLPAPTGLRVSIQEIPPTPSVPTPSVWVKRWEISYQGLDNFFFGRPELSTAKNKITSSGRYAWSEVIKIQHTWEDVTTGHYVMARALLGNSNFGDQTYGVQGAVGWSGPYYQFGVLMIFQKYSEQYYLNEFKYNPKNPPPPPPPGQKNEFSFSSPLPENPGIGLELNFRIPLTQTVNFKINNQLLPGLTTHGFGVEWAY